MSVSKIDVECSICLSILIKPVTLPCGHEFCNGCFEKHLEINCQTCPLCRRRVATWIRKQKDGLINEFRWQTICKNYAKRVNRRLNDENSDSEDDALEFAITQSKSNKKIQTPQSSIKHSKDSRLRSLSSKMENDDSINSLSDVEVKHIEDAKNQTTKCFRKREKKGYYMEQQEERDYKLALKIQKNEKLGIYKVDRTIHGSPYLLRNRVP